MRRILYSMPLLIILSQFALGQSPTPTPTPKPTTNFFKDIARDQKAIWTSPFHIKRSDWKWLGPFLGGTGALIATDKETSSWVARGGSLPGISRDVSWNGGIYVTAGVAGGMYAVGRWTHNDKLAETGRLATEALIDSQIVTQVSKVAFGRLRPNEGDSEGRFFKGGRSFFSGHASASWSVASVIACEYHDHTLAVVAAYGIASAVSISRYTGRKHFLSDVLVGAGVGYGIGRYVCREHGTVAQSPNPVPSTFSWKPVVTPYFDARTGSKGGRLSWSF
jgi:membrane-associated phospholipid phosphatase